MDNIWSTLSRSKYGTKLIIASKSPKKKLTPVTLNMTPNSTEIKQDKLPFYETEKYFLYTFLVLCVLT
jgi:hypothetical protein